MTAEQEGTKVPAVYEVCEEKSNKTIGEMTQEQKAKAYDDFVRGFSQPKSGFGLGCMVQNPHQSKKAAPPYPEEVVMIMDEDAEEVDDCNISTMVSILCPATGWPNVF
jgi:hypothetical protein